MVTVQVGVVPEHPPPLQLVKLDDEAVGAAVRVTLVPGA